MVAMLSIIIGIVFVMLLFSLLATTVMELIAGFLSLRGKHLIAAITGMIGEWAGRFQAHPYFQQLAGSANPGAAGYTPPAYIAPGTFAAILSDLLHENDGETLEQRIRNLPESRFKSVLIFLYRETNGEIDAFKVKLEEWFNEVMARASGAYKNKTKNWLVLLGLLIAVVFNVDPIRIYTNLSMNANLRDYVADMAGAYANNPAFIYDSSAVTPNFLAARQKLDSLLNHNIAAISQPLGLGWHASSFEGANFKWWVFKLTGWLTTALAISLGASFWFDLLKQLVTLRGSGPPPAPTSGGLTSGAVRKL